MLDQFDHEGWQVLPGQGSVMGSDLYLRLFRQQFVKVSAPTCRVFPRAQSACLGSIQDQFDPVSQSACRFRLFRPDRLQNF
ncbi:hypothetical protein D3C81_1722710 [compost metagenome]